MLKKKQILFVLHSALGRDGCRVMRKDCRVWSDSGVYIPASQFKRCAILDTSLNFSEHQLNGDTGTPESYYKD